MGETEKWRQRVEKEENAARQDKIKWGYMHGDAHMVLEKAEPDEFQGHKEYMEKLAKEHMKQEEFLFTGTKKDELTVPVKIRPRPPDHLRYDHVAYWQGLQLPHERCARHLALQGRYLQETRVASRRNYLNTFLI